MNPEQIESLKADDFLLISNTARELHEATVGVLDMQSPQDVEIQEQLRTSIVLKLDESQSHLSKQIADLRGLRKSLEIAQSYASADRARIKAHKIGLWVARKEGRA